MQASLVIYIHAHDPHSPDWAVVDEHGDISNLQSRGEPAKLLPLAKDRQVVVVVPAESILLTTVTLPKMNRQRLLKALPFALEEHLVDDIDALHFATSDFNGKGELSVAVVTKQAMQGWMTLLQAWQIKPDACVPLTLALPMSENAFHIAIGDVANVRMALYNGFACDRDNLAAYLNMAVTENGIPSTIYIHNATSSAIAKNLHINTRIEEEMVSRDDLLTLQAKAVVSMPFINLLQDSFAVKKARLPQTQKMLKIISGLVASWVVLLFLYPFVSYLLLSHRLHQIDGQMEKIYKQHFPASRTMVAPRTRMDDRLRELEGKVGQNRLLLLLGHIGKGLQSATNVKLKRIDYQGGQLTLDLSAASSDDFSGFSDFLASEGLTVKQENATLAGSHVNATLQVE